jgi:UDP-N-acetylmuramyl pentapeptide phosphotransferase/UDP-N-acetylglucosamine-1-phosphate transferase
MFLATTVVSMSAVGFLVYNFPPARIFMGDVGSIPLGFTGGTLMLLGLRDGLFDLWVPMLIFSPFILDATVTVLRRAWRGERIWEAHREHFYQRLVLNGWSHRQAVLSEYGVMLCCGCLAVLYHTASDGWRWAILGAWALLFVWLAQAVNSLEKYVENRNR